MTETSTDATTGRAGARDAEVGTGVPIDVRSLDDQSVLDAMADARRVADRAEAGLLTFAVHYVDLHPATEEHPAATPGDRDRCLRVEPVTIDPATGDPVGLGGPGTPGIAEYAVEPLGGHLSISYFAAYGLLSDAVELCYRLPRLWDLVQAGRLQAWKARQVTAHTRSVSAAAAGFVDRHLAHDAARNRVPTLARLRALTHEALLQCDPDTAHGREEAALVARDVRFDHDAAASTGVSTMTATLDTLDALDLHHTVSEMATTMAHLGDTSPLGVRRAHALGMLARPDRALDLFANQPAEPADPSGDGPGGAAWGEAVDAAGGAPGNQKPGDRSLVFGNPFSRTTATLYVHVDIDDLATHLRTDSGTDSRTDRGSSPEGGPGVGTVEKLGAATLDLIRGWLQRTSHVTIRPVLHPHRGHAQCCDPETGTVTSSGTPSSPDSPRTATSPGTATSRRTATSPSAATSPSTATSPPAPGGGGHADRCCTPVDQHDPPPGMREAVILRDGHCVFPGCTIDARSCDLDHIVAYLDPDAGGPPAQTSPQGLACLCRRHHRLKTFTPWRYCRLSEDDYQWTSPAGRIYLAAPTPKTAPNPL